MCLMYFSFILNVKCIRVTLSLTMNYPCNTLTLKTSFYKFYKFIQNTVGNYVHTYTQLHICTINKHTYQDQYKIKYLHK